MIHKISLTIGIPAFNEGQNIENILQDVLSQKLQNILLKEIIVVSDGSTDDTDKKIQSVRDKRIHFIRNDKRRGLAAVQNTILARTATDVLVLLQGDIRLGAPDAISEMIKPILENNADLVVPASRELKPKTFFEQILFASCVMKTRIYENYNNGENIYTCRGIARAFSKKMYQSIHFPTSVGEDAYSYLYCLKKKMKYGFTKKAKVYYRLPNNVKDHLKQSLRFFNSQQLLYKTFKEDFVKKEYSLPKQLLLQSFFQSSRIHRD
jgi:glycosyltransferase involved in cell wall biosynthesis